MTPNLAWKRFPNEKHSTTQQDAPNQAADQSHSDSASMPALEMGVPSRTSILPPGPSRLSRGGGRACNTEGLYPGEALVTVGAQRGKVMADQIMAADKSHLKAPLGALSKEDLRAVGEAIQVHMGSPQ